MKRNGKYYCVYAVLVSTVFLLHSAEAGTSKDLAGTEINMRKGVAATHEGTELAVQELSRLLEGISAYEYGQSRKPLVEVSDLLRTMQASKQCSREIERLFLVFLRSDATLASKQFVCHNLSILGSEQSIPTLSAMLIEPETSDMSQYALERIPGLAVNEALRNALHKTAGKARIGIINTLGVRRDNAAVGELNSLLDDVDSEVVRSAITSLGKIGSLDAAWSLDRAKSKLTRDFHRNWGHACLACADKLVADSKTEYGLAICRELYSRHEAPAIRFAALKRLTAQGNSVSLVLDAITGEDPFLGNRSLQLVREFPGVTATRAFVEKLPKLSWFKQALLLCALGDRGDEAALPAVRAATKDRNQHVRIEALRALAKLGDASCVMFLAEVAATTDGLEQEVARESLCHLEDPGVDKTILSSVSRAGLGSKVELIRCIGQRNIGAAAEILVEFVSRETDSGVRLESIKALGLVCDEENLPDLISLFSSVKNDAERNEAEKTLLCVCQQTNAESGRTDAIVAALLRFELPSAKYSLVRVLGKMGDSNALPAIRDALNSDDDRMKTTAIRALSRWPSAEPLADLRRVAAGSDSEHRLLALRGFINLIGQPSTRPEAETARLYSDALSLSSRYEEKKLILSGLANVKSVEALKIAGACLDNEAMRAEAAAAVVKICRAIKSSEPAQAKIMLRKVISLSVSDATSREATEIIAELK